MRVNRSPYYHMMVGNLQRYKPALVAAFCKANIIIYLFFYFDNIVYFILFFFNFFFLCFI